MGPEMTHEMTSYLHKIPLFCRLQGNALTPETDASETDEAHSGFICENAEKENISALRSLTLLCHIKIHFLTLR